MDINERVEKYDENLRSTVYAYTSETSPGLGTIRVVIGELSVSVDFRFHEGGDGFNQINDTLSKIAKAFQYGGETILEDIVERKNKEINRLNQEVGALEKVNDKLRTDRDSDNIADPVADGMEEPATTG